VFDSLFVEEGFRLYNITPATSRSEASVKNVAKIGENKK